MSLAPLMSSAKQDWRTPRRLFEAVEALAGGFDLDAAADGGNHLVTPWLGPGGLAPDALTTDWYRGHSYRRAWLNPPYGRSLWPFVAKAVEQVNKYPGFEVWMLVPARPDTRWWALAIERAVSVRFLAGRVKFELPDGARESAPFPSAVIRLGYEGGNPSVVWGWRP